MAPVLTMGQPGSAALLAALLRAPSLGCRWPNTHREGAKQPRGSLLLLPSCLMHVCVHLCVRRSAHLCICLQRPEVSVACASQPLSTLVLGQGLPLNHGANTWAPLSSSVRNIGARTVVLGFFSGCWTSSSGFRVCTSDISPPPPSQLPGSNSPPSSGPVTTGSTLVT